jgi:hypothetical protein
MRQRGERGVQQAAHAERGAAPPRVMLCHCGLNLTVLHREPRLPLLGSLLFLHIQLGFCHSVCACHSCGLTSYAICKTNIPTARNGKREPRTRYARSPRTPTTIPTTSSSTYYDGRESRNCKVQTQKLRIDANSELNWNWLLGIGIPIQFLSRNIEFFGI